ncbi:MAG: tungsten ABC transporter permease [Desulfurococcales archaeon ex4484_58]|nr:MAG: tungsten ABC transporter permease [Desulfurococcales archaeon ex4484_58]
MNKIIKTLIIVVALIIVLSLTINYLLQINIVHVRVTTTTSLYATGLLEELEEEFKKRNPNVEIDFIPVGSGEALRRARDGEACMVFVHAPSLEEKYLSEGVIGEHHIFAYNYFIIAGPPNDPAEVKNSSLAIEAFRKIYFAGEKGYTKFISRGDYSGTHIKELAIWNKTGLDPHGKKWYFETGSGMAQTLLVAEEENAYVLSDIGTFLKFKKEGKLPDLEILYSNSTELINIYSVYIVESCSGVERSVAEKFLEFVVTEGQDVIASYGVEEYGVNLFYPARDKLDELRDIWVELSK